MGKHHHHKGGKGSATSAGSGSSSAAPYVRCYHSHPAYPVAEGVVIYGGSGNDPCVLDADVYIGFDHGMKRTSRRFPWSTGEEVHFIIQDMGVPADLENFQKLIEWTAEQLLAGKKVHAGCIGGHGRTGLFFAALRKHMSGDVDAIQHVREHYCKKTVESKAQVEWLMKHYGVSEAEATKQSAYTGGNWNNPSYSKAPSSGYSSQPTLPAGRNTGQPTNAVASVWGG